MKIILLVILLAGCTTSKEYGMKLEARYGSACTVIGFEKGTEGYGACILGMQRNVILESYKR